MRKDPAGAHLYIIQSAVTGAVKVGRSGNPERRLGEIQVGSPHRLKLILVAPEAGHRERAVHRSMERYRTRWADGEWFEERGLGEVPSDLWELAMPWYMADPDWWKNR